MTVFCNLPDGQKAALLFIESIIAAPPGKFAKLKDALANQKWDVIATIASMVNDSAPPASDFQAVGTMSDGLRNAYFTLAMVDAKATDDAKASLAKALDTCCWDEIAGQIVTNISTTGLTFTGEDLHRAYAPTDTRGCKKPSGFEIAIGDMIKDGKLVGDFFSRTLPDFFENDFANFFTGTIPGFFTGQFVDFFKDFGDSLKNGFEGLGETLEDAFKDLGAKLNPSNW